MSATAVAAVLAGCGTGGGDRRTAPAPPRPKANGYITVVVADTIAPVIEREARAFQAANRLASVTVQSGGSSMLATELLRGRVTDLYVAAGTVDMDRVVAAELVYGAPLKFARGPNASAGPADYSVVLMNTTGDQTTSRVFMQFLITPAGRSILEDGGFRPRS